MAGSSVRKSNSVFHELPMALVGLFGRNLPRRTMVVLGGEIPGLLQLIFEGLADFAELGPQLLQLFGQDGTHGLLDDIFDDRVGRVVRPAGLAFGLVVGEIDVPLVDDDRRLAAAFCQGRGKGDVFLPLALGLRRQVLFGDLELELQQPLVDRAQVADFKRLVIDEHQRKGPVVRIAG